MKSIISRTVLLCMTVGLLAGCVVNQSLDMEYEAAAKSDIGSGVTVIAAVNDERPYVTSGDKTNHFIGQYRSGFGIPYDVSTDNEEPLASLVLRDLRKDLDSMGFASATSGSGQRTLEITINDWNFDSYQNGEFTYDVDVAVSDASGNAVASSKVANTIQVKGTFWTGGKGGFEKAMPGMYRDLIKALVRDNEKVLGALTK